MKNPAVLLYTSDFITGTLFMSNEEVGAYIRLLCMQHQKGHLSKEEIKQICKDNNVFNSVIVHFKKDEKGFYYNERMELEKEKRTKYSESRANNRKKVDNDNTCIYLMINNKTKLIKIGSSNNPERRLIEIRNYYKEDCINLYAYCENKQQALEKELHDKYKNKWCYDEWYKLTSKDIEDIIKSNDMKLHMNNHMIKHMNNHMENENENINNNNINNNIYFNNIELNNVFIEWLKYKKERKETYKETGLKSLITQIKNQIDIYGEKQMIDLITECMANNYKGIIFDKLKNKPSMPYRKKQSVEPEWLNKEIKKEENTNEEVERLYKQIRDAHRKQETI